MYSNVQKSNCNAQKHTTNAILLSCHKQLRSSPSTNAQADIKSPWSMSKSLEFSKMALTIEP